MGIWRGASGHGQGADHRINDRDVSGHDVVFYDRPARAASVSVSAITGGMLPSTSVKP
jgi:hypothetical protein